MTAEIWDVIIVGAGLSGLSAAHHLLKRNADLKILLLEGKDRVGGRTVTVDIPAAGGVDRWDLGAQWVGSTQTHIMELIEELGLETYLQYYTGKKVHHTGGPGGKVRIYSSSLPSVSPLTILDQIQFLWKIDALCDTVCAQDPSRTPNAVELDSMTLHSYVEKNAWTTEMKEEMGVCSRTVFGMEPSQMSFLFFLVSAAAAGGLVPMLENTAGGAQEMKIKGGTQQLSELLAQRIGWKKVQLGSAVTTIWQDAEMAKVTTASDTFLCRAVIVSCPPHLAAKIHYQPALPSQREFLTQNMPVGHLMKFIITYQTAFWKEKGFSGEVMTGSSTGCPFSVTFDATSPSGNAALVGFMAGEGATRWTSKESAERREAVISSLVKYLGPEAAAFIHYEDKDWAKEEYSGGCPVNVMAPGMLTYYHASLRKPVGRIHWAGSETATRWCGYLSGAVQSGQRAAVEVLAELCPTVLTQEELGGLLLSQSAGGPPEHTQSSASRVSPLPLILAALAVGAAVALAKRPNAIPQAKSYLTRLLPGLSRVF